MKIRGLLLLGLLALALGACSPDLPGSSVVATVTVDITPSPTQPDKATVVGRIVSSRTNQPLATSVSLAQVTRQNGQAVMALDVAHSPSVDTKADGSFVLPNIDAHEYVVVVGDIYGKYVIITETKDKARVFDAKIGTITNIGELRVDM